MMDRAEIARRLILMVDDWRDGPVSKIGLSVHPNAHMLIKITMRRDDDPADAITLVVGTEPAVLEALEPDIEDDDE